MDSMETFIYCSYSPIYVYGGKCGRKRKAKDKKIKVLFTYFHSPDGD